MLDVSETYQSEANSSIHPPKKFLEIGVGFIEPNCGWIFGAGEVVKRAPLDGLKLSYKRGKEIPREYENIHFYLPFPFP